MATVLSLHDRGILTAVNSGASSLSFVGSGFIVLCYSLFKELRKFSFKLVFYLSLSVIFLPFLKFQDFTSTEVVTTCNSLFCSLLNNHDGYRIRNVRYTCFVQFNRLRLKIQFMCAVRESRKENL